MILGIGTDIVKVDRVRQKLLADRGFRDYVFSQAEIAYCEAQAYPYMHYAGRFAAKEALLKALGTGLASPLPLPSAEIRRQDSGAPFFAIQEDMLTALFPAKQVRIHVSIAHEKDYALAHVIIESIQH